MSMDVTIDEAGPGAGVRFYDRIGGDLDSLDRVVCKLGATGAQLWFAYGAGPSWARPRGGEPSFSLRE